MTSEHVRFVHRYAARNGGELSSYGYPKTRTILFARTGTGQGRRWFCSECGQAIRPDVTHLADSGSSARLHLGCGEET